MKEVFSTVKRESESNPDDDKLLIMGAPDDIDEDQQILQDTVKESLHTTKTGNGQWQKLMK